MASKFEQLASVKVDDKVEKKNRLDYLSWAWAWAELKKVAPDANYTVYENEQGWPYFTDGKTCWVKVGVVVDGVEIKNILPVMDHMNRSIPLERVTSMDMNKSIQRCMTKAIAMHGLGLSVYAGEDIDFDEQPAQEQKPAQKKQEGPSFSAQMPKTSNEPPKPFKRSTSAEYSNKVCAFCKNPVNPEFAKGSLEKYGVCLCGKECRNEYAKVNPGFNAMLKMMSVSNKKG